MKRFIFGFHRRVWWPKWTPASRSCRMETTAIEMFLQSVLSPGAAPPAGGDRGKHQVMLVGVATHRSVGRTMVAARAAVRSLGARGGDQARGCVPPYTLRRRS